MKRQRFQLLDIRPSHIDRLAELPMHHRDPFDRMLIAQALAEGMTIVSGDDALRLYGVSKVIF
jgi:PIN domain nuclease of toxin-antitoxin system